MTSREAMALRAGTWVWLRWPGTADGTDKKRASVVRVNAAGTKVAVQVHRVRCGGEYTGEVGRSVRWFPAEDIIEVDGRYE